MPTEILAPLHFTTLLNAHAYLIADFYATWCPPCKQIAPIYAQLSAAHALSAQLVFVKINVDEQRELAAKYGVTAMPTFLVFKNGQKIKEVRGADVRGLKANVESVVEELKGMDRERKVGKEDEQVLGKGEEAAEEKTVSGSYGLSKNSSWKMSLR
jgi:thioredoxin 1